MKKIVLIGNPNVGKSAIFSRLTGANVIASNYSGTTVEYTKGKVKLPSGEKAEVFDVPGTYTLDPTSKAEEVVVEMIEEADIIINIIDSTNLERNLNLTVQLLQKTDTPVIVNLNMDDIATQNGIFIDDSELSEELGVPVVPTAALSGEGVKQLLDNIQNAMPGKLDYPEDQKWSVIGSIVEKVQDTEHRHPTIRERIAEATIHHISGPILAVLTLYISFWLVRFIGENIIGYVMEPLFNTLWLPVLQRLSVILGPQSFLHKILIGNLIEGSIDFGQSFGLLSTGLFIPLAAVLPYILAFYIVLSLLEDVGYLPRLGVLIDNVMHKLGLHGLSIIPMLLGLGCNVPGALGTRVLESRKERFIASTLMAIAVPCMAQIAMISGLLGEYGPAGFFPFIGILVSVWLIVGLLLKKYTKGETPEIMVDIPPYHFPYWKSILKKVWMRVRGFVLEAIPFVLLGVFIVNILYTVGIIEFMGKIFSPIVTKVFGLPQEAIAALLVGFLRKDIAVGMLAPLGLNLRQIIVASVVLTIYFPCVATFIVLLRELGIKDMVKAGAVMIATALLVGGIANWGMIALGI